MGADVPARRGRALAVAGGRTFLSGDPATVAWLTGLAPDAERGGSPFAVAPIVVLDREGRLFAVVSEDEAAGVDDGVEAVTFRGFAVEEVDRRAEAATLALSLLGDGSAAADVPSLPGSLVAALAGRELVDVAAGMRRARAVKDPDEIDGIRAAVTATDRGQAAARELLASGRSELELWTAARSAMEAAAGTRIPVLGDLVTGPRTAGIGGPPTERRLLDDDLLLVDLGPRVRGYWSDSCATIALGDVPAHVQEAHAAAVEALAAAKAAVRPGVTAGTVDAATRALGDYPHHTGHGVGRTVHEEPRIVPGSEQLLEAGMVIALEPGRYGTDWGVRVEQIVLVTDEGCDVLSGHDLTLQK